LSFPWWQFQKESELPPLLERVEKYPKACVRWLWGTKALVLVYDPDYMKVFLGRSGKKETLSWRQSFIWVHVPGCEIPEETDTSDIKAWAPPNTLPTKSKTRISLSSYFLQTNWDDPRTGIWFPVHTDTGWAPLTVASSGSWDGQMTTRCRKTTGSFLFSGSELSLCFRAIHHLSPVGVLLWSTKPPFLGPQWLSGQKESGMGSKSAVASERLSSDKNQERKGVYGLDLSCSGGSLPSLLPSTFLLYLSDPKPHRTYKYLAPWIGKYI